MIFVDLVDGVIESFGLQIELQYPRSDTLLVRIQPKPWA